MTDFAEKIVAFVLTTIITGVAWAVRTLFVRLRDTEARQSGFEERFRTLEKQATASDRLRTEIQSLTVEVTAERVRREDWVPTMSRVLGALERQSETLGRLDERLKHMEERGK